MNTILTALQTLCGTVMALLIAAYAVLALTSGEALLKPLLDIARYIW